jgi:CheY-like chemotaxis protein
LTESNRTILVVDDDRDIRETLSEILRDEGYRVATAANGSEALKLLRSLAAAPALVLLDLMMPVMDGYRFLEERGKDPALASIPVAVISAGGGFDRERLYRIPVVPKPFSLPQLLTVVERFV